MVTVSLSVGLGSVAVELGATEDADVSVMIGDVDGRADSVLREVTV